LLLLLLLQLLLLLLLCVDEPGPADPRSNFIIRAACRIE
jgi:hypothetical protein